MPFRAYLAGPDVFHPEATALGARKLALCRDFGLLGLYPGEGPATDGAAIYRSCLAMMALVLSSRTTVNVTLLQRQVLFLNALAFLPRILRGQRIK